MKVKMETAFDEMVEKVMESDRLCEACMFEHEGCPGLTVGRSGEPSFPPCSQGIPAEGYIEPKLLKAVYDEIVEEMELTNREHHRKILDELNELYARKNHDYGDSFHQSYIDEGLAMVRIRLGDKLSRFKTLTRKGEQKVQDETIRDTLLDLANYAVMTVMELEREEG